MTRVRAEGREVGRPRIDAEKEKAIKKLLAKGVGLNSIARQVEYGTSAVQRVQRSLAA